MVPRFFAISVESQWKNDGETRHFSKALPQDSLFFRQYAAADPCEDRLPWVVNDGLMTETSTLGRQRKRGAATGLSLALLAAVAAANPVGETPRVTDASSDSPLPLHVERLGESGPIALFLPGVDCHADVWRPFAEAISGGHRAFLVTPAGFADIPPGGFEERFYEAILPALSRLLDREGASGATVVGHSAGGLVALALARAEPARVNSVLVVDTIPFPAAAAIPGATPGQVAAVAKRLHRQMRRMPEKAYREQQTMNLRQQSMTTEFHPTLRAWMLASHVRTSATAFVETLRVDLRPTLAEVKQPVLVLAPWDADLGVAPEASHEWYLELYANAPNVDIQMVRDSYSYAMVDQPQAVAAALAKALAR